MVYMINFISFAAGNIFYNFLDDGVANVLGLETLRHGTNPLSNLLLRINGGNPKFGGASTGSTKNWNDDDTRNYFYLFKDSEFRPDSPNLSDRLTKIISKILFFSRLLPRYHAALSGFNLASRFLNEKSLTNESIIIKCFRVFVGCIGGAASLLISPTLRFRFAKISPKRLENDPAYGGCAYRTKQIVEPWRLGLIGSLITGVNLDWFARAKAHPLKVLTGTVQLTCAIAMAVLGTRSLLTNPTLIIPTALGAVLA